MAYESVAEILDSIDGTRSRLLARIESLNADDENLRASSDGWTVAEIVEHLAIIEDQLTKLTGMMLTKAEAGGERAELRIKPVSIDHFIERSLNEKYQAPEAVRPRGGVAIADSIVKMRRTRETLRALRPRLEATNLATVQYPHPAFGPLNLYEWLILIGAHEERHLRQIERVMQSSEGDTIRNNLASLSQLRPAIVLTTLKLSITTFLCAPIAQWLERQTHNLSVRGSSPRGGTQHMFSSQLVAR